MPRTRLLFASLIAFLTLSAHAQSASSVSAGISIGIQRYLGAIDNPRVITSAEVLLRHSNFGLHLAGEYADLSDEGALIVFHPNVVYVSPIAKRWSILAGVGPTYASVGSAGHRSTWNAEVELSRRVEQTDVFLRLRYFDYALVRTRQGGAGPNGPEISVGARFRTH